MKLLRHPTDNEPPKLYLGDKISGVITKGLYEGNNAKISIDRNSEMTVYDGKDPYTYFGDYKDDNLSIMLGKYEYKGDHTVVAVMCYDVELAKTIKPPFFFMEGVDKMTDDEVMTHLKKSLCNWITAPKDRGYEGAVRAERYWDNKEFLQYWNDAQKEERIADLKIMRNNRDEFFFLSNDCPCKIEYNGQTYGSVTEAFEAQKSRDDFFKKRNSIIQDLIYLKFEQNEDLRDKIRAMNDDRIEYLCDDDWLGVNADGIGANKVGQTLMVVRQLMKDEYGVLEKYEQQTVFGFSKSLQNELPSKEENSMQTFSKADVITNIYDKQEDKPKSDGMETIVKPKSSWNKGVVQKSSWNKGTVQNNSWKKSDSTKW